MQNLLDRMQLQTKSSIAKHPKGNSSAIPDRNSSVKPKSQSASQISSSSGSKHFREI